MDETDPPDPDARIFVQNIPDKCYEDTLIVFFERKQTFGRELMVTHVNYDRSTNTAVITFHSKTDVQTVLACHNRRPCRLQDNVLRIEVYKDVPSTDQPTAIEVSGYPISAGLDGLRYYFENTRRSGGGHVDDIITDTGNDDTIHVTFSDAAAVESVLRRSTEKQHVIGDYRLTVRPLIMSDREVCLTNLPGALPGETIKDFLSAKLDNEALSLTYSSTRNTAVVTFENTIDFPRAQAKLSQHRCGGRYLEATRVPVTNCVLVRQLPLEATEETCTNYFENKRRSGGGPVHKIDFRSQDGYCLIYFEDINDARSTCAVREHKLLDTILTISPYHSCLGPPAPTPHKPYQIPGPIEVDKDTDMKLKLATRTTEGKEALEALLGKHHCRLTKEPVTLECTLTANIPGYRQLIGSWTSVANEALNEFVSNIHTKYFKLDKESFTIVRERLWNLSIQHPERTVVKLKRDQRMLILVSFKNVYRDLCTQIKRFIDSVQLEIRLNNSQITKECGFKKWQVQYMTHNSFAGWLVSKYPHLSTEFDVENSFVKLKGADTDVSGAALDIYERLQSVREHVIKVKTEVSLLLTKDKIKQTLDRKLVGQNIASDLCRVTDDSIQIVVDENTDIFKVESILQRSFKVLDIPLNSSPVLQDPEKLSELLESLDRQFGEVLVIARHRHSFSLYFTLQISDTIDAHINSYISDNDLVEETCKFDENELRFIRKGLNVEQRLSGVQKDNNVTLEYNDNGNIRIKGTRNGIRIVRQLLKRLTRRVSCKTDTMVHPGIQRYLTSKSGKEAIANIERSTPCLMIVEFTKIIEHKDSFGQGVRCAEVLLQTGQKIIVHGGDMSKLSVDVIVNASNIQMNHTGGLAAAIVEAGGQKIQEECTAYVTKNGSLSVGDVYMGAPGALQCKGVAHAVGPQWTGGRRRESEILRKVVQKCMTETGNRQLTSIALPALCTGMFRYPVDKSCTQIVTSLVTYFQANQSSIKEVYLCDISVKTINEFIRALKSTLTNVTHLVQLEDQTVIYRRDRSSSQKSKPSTKRTHTNPTYTIGNTVVELVKGDMAYEKVDVIVNSTSPDLKLVKGRGSKALLKVGGAGIQTECDQKFPKGVTQGQVAITGPGSLKCKDLFHVAVPAHTDATSLQTFDSVVTNCLLEANKLQRSSIAFPAIGTGAQGFPKDVSADRLLKAIETHCTNSPNTTLKRIRLVIYKLDTDTHGAFDTEFKKFAAKYPAKAAAPSDTKGKPDIKPIMHLGSGREGQSGSGCEGCSITVYADGRDAVERAFDRIEGVMESEWYTQKIEDASVWKIDQTQITKIDASAKANDVYVCVDQDIGAITIQGLLKDASTVMDTICEELRVIGQNQHEIQNAQLKAKIIQWKYVHGASSVEFPEIDNYRIEKAYSNKDTTVKLKNTAGDEYVIDLQTLKMHFLKQPATLYDVQRRNLIAGSFALPPGWDPMNSGEKLKKVTLAPTSPEYQNAVAEFQKTLGRQPNIIKVERVQNLHLIAQYQYKRDELISKNPGIQNERVLWHGTGVDAIQNIIANGFNRSYGGGSYGKGVYFAVNSRYSDGGYARPDPAGHKRMLRTHVLVGHSVNGVSSMTVLPERQPGIQYDSASNNVASPIMFIIFNDTQAYPEHIITYT